MKRALTLTIKWTAFIQYALLWHAGLFISGVPVHDPFLFTIATQKV